MRTLDSDSTALPLSFRSSSTSPQLPKRLPHTVVWITSTLLFIREILWSYYWEGNELKILFSLCRKPYFQDCWFLMDSETGSCLWDLNLHNDLFVLGGSFPSWSTKTHCFHGWRASGKHFQDTAMHSKYILSMLSIPLKPLFPQKVPSPSLTHFWAHLPACLLRSLLFLPPDPSPKNSVFPLYRHLSLDPFSWFLT